MHLKHKVDYYQDTTQAIRLMRTEFREMFMTRTISYQEKTLLGLIVCKEMMIWSKKFYQVLEKVEYIREIKKG
jgi:hypothetical protein